MGTANLDARGARCATRILKNIAALRRMAPDLAPPDLPLERIVEAIPLPVLERLHIPIEVDPSHPHPARTRFAAYAPQIESLPFGGMFQGTLYFVQLKAQVYVRREHQPVPGAEYFISDADMATAIEYATVATKAIHQYASLYGPNSIAVDPHVIPFSVRVPNPVWDSPMGIYDAGTFQGWVEDIRTENQIPDGSCVVVLNPSGLNNTWADVNNAAGYHASTPRGPYIFCYTGGRNWTIDDAKWEFANVLSHEIAETVVDPAGLNGAPEVCDPCAAPTLFLAYFESLRGGKIKYLGTESYPANVRRPVDFSYTFYIAAMISPTLRPSWPQVINDPNLAGVCAFAPPT